MMQRMVVRVNRVRVVIVAMRSLGVVVRVMARGYLCVRSCYHTHVTDSGARALVLGPGYQTRPAHSPALPLAHTPGGGAITEGG